VAEKRRTGRGCVVLGGRYRYGLSEIYFIKRNSGTARPCGAPGRASGRARVRVCAALDRGAVAARPRGHIVLARPSASVRTTLQRSCVIFKARAAHGNKHERSPCSNPTRLRQNGPRILDLCRAAQAKSSASCFLRRASALSEPMSSSSSDLSLKMRGRKTVLDSVELALRRGESWRCSGRMARAKTTCSQRRRPARAEFGVVESEANPSPSSTAKARRRDAWLPNTSSVDEPIGPVSKPRHESARFAFGEPQRE